MNLLGLIKIINNKMTLKIQVPKATEDVEVALRNHFKTRLQGNRYVQHILKAIKEKNTLTLNEVSEVLEKLSPHISATKQTWLKNARTLAKWMDIAELVLWDRKNRMLICFNPATDIRERHLLLPKRRGAKTPWSQYSHVEKIVTRLVQALQGNGRVDWFGLSKNIIFKALAALEDLGFIIRGASVIKVLPKGIEFVLNPDKRPMMFAESALLIPSFSVFIDILKTHQVKGNTLLGLGLELRDTLGENWRESSAEVIAKIMLDWARHAKLAPGIFAETRRGPIKGWKKKGNRQMTLF
jgi:hypothetical protein